MDLICKEYIQAKWKSNDIMMYYISQCFIVAWIENNGGRTESSDGSNTGMLNLKSLGEMEFEQKGIILLDLKFAFI